MGSGVARPPVTTTRTRAVGARGLPGRCSRNRRRSPGGSPWCPPRGLAHDGGDRTKVVKRPDTDSDRGSLPRTIGAVSYRARQGCWPRAPLPRVRPCRRPTGTTPCPPDVVSPGEVSRLRSVGGQQSGGRPGPLRRRRPSPGRPTRRPPTPPARVPQQGGTAGPRESGTNRGYAAASSTGSGSAFSPGYQRWNVARRSSFKTRARTWSNRSAPRSVHRICCFLTIRWLIT